MRTIDSKYDILNDAGRIATGNVRSWIYCRYSDYQITKTSN